MSVQFCHNLEEDNVNLKRAEIHMKLRRWKGPGQISALLELQSGSAERLVLTRALDGAQARWKTLDITALVQQNGWGKWRVGLKFQVILFGKRVP